MVVFSCSKTLEVSPVCKRWYDTIALRSVWSHRSTEIEKIRRISNSLYTNKKYTEAHYWYKKILKIDSKDRSANVYLGHCYYELGKKEEAFNQFEISLELFKDDPGMKSIHIL